MVIMAVSEPAIRDRIAKAQVLQLTVSNRYFGVYILAQWIGLLIILIIIVIEAVTIFYNPSLVLLPLYPVIHLTSCRVILLTMSNYCTLTSCLEKNKNRRRKKTLKSHDFNLGCWITRTVFIR